MKAPRHLLMTSLVATALAAIGCSEPRPAEAPPKKAAAPEEPAKPTKPAVEPPNDDRKIKEDDVQKAKKRAEDFMRKFGPKIMADMATKNVGEFRKGLAGGAELRGMKKYDVAIAAIRSSLATKPNDARALAALSEVALESGDLPTAEATALLGVGRAFDRRVATQLQEQLAAIATRRGAKLPATGVLSRLQRIGSAVEPLGPAADLDALCKLIEPVIPKDTSGINCLPPRAKKVEAGGGALLEAAYLPVITAKTETHHIVALRTEAGWFAVAELAQVSELKTFYAAPDKFEVTRFELAQLIDGGPEELLVDFTQTINDCDPGINEREEGTRKTVLVCGLREGKPGCFARIPYLLDRKRVVISEAMEEDVKKGEHIGELPYSENYALKVDFVPKSGTVEITVAAGDVPQDRRQLVGTHTL